MGQVLYRKYRSEKLSQVIGQDHITSTLDKALKKGLIGHAYLFTGPRGVGKTSVARILAHEVNKVAFDQQAYVDIIEIDAASNRRIDEIRELRETVNLAPTSLKYKVYIIDEVHMLTREAFNALLKTLEEPPEHVIFILATTELHKVPETIVSRCQRFNFKAIANKDAITRLKDIAKTEKIAIDNDSLQIIAEQSRGSFRDALSLLEQLTSLHGKIKAEDTRNILGLASDETVEQLLEASKSNSTLSVINKYRQAIEAGNDPVILANQLIAWLRLNLAKSDNYNSDIELMTRLLDVADSKHPESLLEIILLSHHSNIGQQIGANAHSKQKNETEQEISPTITKSQPKKSLKKPERKITKPKSNKPEKKLNKEAWSDILSALKPKSTTLYGILRMARSEIDDGRLILRFGFPFHLKRAQDPQNKLMLEDIMSELGYGNTIIELVHDPSIIQNVDEEVSEQTQVPQDILDVFTGAEVMES